MDKTCQECNTPMFAVRSDKIFCAPCLRRHRTKQALERSRLQGTPPRGTKDKEIICQCCGLSFFSERRTRRWCDDCLSLRLKDRHQFIIERPCQWCKSSMIIQRGKRNTSNKRYCSIDCKRAAALESRIQSRLRDKLGQPKLPGGRPRLYTKAVATKLRNGSLQVRFFIRYPERHALCQSCGEKRVVELAHKQPRRSAWRTMPTSEEVWILCPTCHRCLDLGIQTREELGLSE